MSVNFVSFENGQKVARPITSREEYLALRNQPRNRAQRALARTNDDAKARLVQFNYSGHYPNGLLRGNKLIANAFVFDVDDVREFDRIAQQLIDPSTHQPTALASELQLLMLERSARNGGHAVFARMPGRTILENQVRIATQLHCEMDTSTHDTNRVLFTTTGDSVDLLYLSEELFTDAYDAEQVEQETQLLEERVQQHQEDVPAGAHHPNKHYRPWEDGMVSSEVLGAEAVSSEAVNSEAVSSEVANSEPSAEKTHLTYQGIDYATIITKYWELYNDGNEPVEGNRNSLTFELAVNLAAICDYDLRVLQQVIPRYDGLGVQEWKDTLVSALKQPRKGMPYRLRQTLTAVHQDMRMTATGGTTNTPPQLPRRLPPLVSLLTSKVPAYYKPAVVISSLSALSAHLHGVEFVYIDNNLHEFQLMDVLVGQQSIGKSSVNKPIEYIMKPIKAADAINRQRENEWKRQNPVNKSKAKDPRPTDIVVRYLASNLTPALLNQRFIDAEQNGKYSLYLSVNELDALLQLSSSRRMKDVALLMRLGYDCAETGQERVGSDGVSGLATCRFCLHASTTPTNAKKYLSAHVNDGTMGRLVFSTIIRDEDDDSMPVFGKYDQQFEDDLKPYLHNLDIANGVIDCEPAKRKAMQLKKKCDQAARAMESDAYRVLSHRSIASAMRAAVMLYLAHGQKWSKELGDLMEWMVSYDMWNKMVLFGEQLEEELTAEKKIQQTRGPQNMLEMLPARFTRDDYYQLRIRLNKEGNGDATLRVWMSRGYVEYDDTTGEYLNKKSAK